MTSPVPLCVPAMPSASTSHCRQNALSGNKAGQGCLSKNRQTDKWRRAPRHHGARVVWPERVQCRARDSDRMKLLEGDRAVELAEQVASPSSGSLLGPIVASRIASERAL